MEAAELKEISRGINSAVGGAVGQFRQASEQSTKTLNSIIKDLYKAVASQSSHIEELDQTTDELISTSRATSAKIDSTNNLLEQTINIQNNMYSVLRTMGYDIKTMNENVKQINTGSMLGTMLEQTGIGGFMKSAMGVLGAALTGGAIGAGVGYMVGGGGGGAAGGGGTGGGNVSNPVMAKDIYSYLTKEKGVDHAHAVGILANIQNESKFDSGAYNKNDINGPSGGLFQHHDNYNTGEHRFSSMKQAAGPDWQKNWKGQVDFALSERDMQNYLKTPVSSGEQAASEFVYKFERPKDKPGEAAKRAHNVPAIEKLVAGGAQATSSTPTATPMPQSTPTTPTAMSGASGQTPTTQTGGGEAHGGGHGHGIISGPMGSGGGETHGKMAGVQPGIQQKFEEINSKAGIPLTVTSGFRDPQENARVGGAQNSAHTRGNAVDVKFNGGVDETNKLIKVASAAGIGGIGVYAPGVLHFDTEGKRAWGPNYHSDSIPGWALPAIQQHLGGATPQGGGGYSETGGTSGGMGGMGMGVRPLTSFASMTGSGVVPNLGNMGAPGAYAQAAMSGVGSVQNMGGFGGAPMGGMAPVAMALAGSLAPVLLSAMQQSAQSPDPELQAELQTATMAPPPPAETPDILKNVQIERELERQNSNKLTTDETNRTAAREQAVYINQSTSGQPQYPIDYNHELDRGWADWVSKLGQIGYPEMNKIKLWG